MRTFWRGSIFAPAVEIAIFGTKFRLIAKFQLLARKWTKMSTDKVCCLGYVAYSEKYVPWDDKYLRVSLNALSFSTYEQLLFLWILVQIWRKAVIFSFASDSTVLVNLVTGSGERNKEHIVEFCIWAHMLVTLQQFLGGPYTGVGTKNFDNRHDDDASL